MVLLVKMFLLGNANNYAPNAIDPTIFYNSNGKQLFMTYGSWSGGIFILEINKATGKPKYPGVDGTYANSKSHIDIFWYSHCRW